jgi:hypothetical protein
VSRVTRLIAARELGAFRRTGALWAFLGTLALVQGLHLLAFAVDERRTTERALAIFFHHGAYVMEAAGVVLALALVVMGRPAEMLWRTAPIRASQRVGGLFGAGLAVLVLASLATVHLPAFVLYAGHGSVGHLVAGSLGGLLAGALGLALGLAGTALFRRPLAGAVAAGAVLGGLELLPMVADRAQGGGRAVLVEAAPVWAHNDGFRRGILDLSDAVFLLGLGYVALVAATVGLRERRWAP